MMSKSAPDGAAGAAKAEAGFLPVRTAGLILFLVWLSFWLVRMAGPVDLWEKHFERQAAYVLDALLNGNWVCQETWYGWVAPKPPLYTWLSLLATLPFGRISEGTLFFPAALSMLLSAFLIWHFGRRWFGSRAAWFAALMFLASPYGLRMIWQARYDGVFTTAVLLTAMLGFRAWVEGRGWGWFWVAAAIATLAKGPLGLLLGGLGLAAWFWERRQQPPPPIRGRALAGLGWYVLIAGGWFFLSYLKFGKALIDQMIVSELVGSSTNWSLWDAKPWETVFKPTLYFLSRFLPWSLLGIAAFWRVFKSPAAESQERLFERFLVCWFGLGLILFSLAPHQRPDLIFPLIPAAALLAGRELDRRFRPANAPRFNRILTAVWLLLVIGLYGYYTLGRENREVAARNRQWHAAAAQLEATFGRPPALVYAEDAPFVLQIFLSTKQNHVSFAEAAQQLAGTRPVHVVVRDPARLRELLPAGHAVTEELRWPATGDLFFYILTNAAPDGPAAGIVPPAPVSLPPVPAAAGD